MKKLSFLQGSNEKITSLSIANAQPQGLLSQSLLRFDQKEMLAKQSYEVNRQKLLQAKELSSTGMKYYATQQILVETEEWERNTELGDEPTWEDEK